VSRTIYREIGELGSWIEIGNRLKYFDFETEELLKPFDDIIIKQLRSEIVLGNFDPVTGSIGFGYYLANRMRSNGSLGVLLGEIVASLNLLAYHTNEGAFYKSKLKGDDSIYLGISHGIAGVLNFLIQIAEHKIVDIDHALIRKCVNYIKSNKLQHDPLLFPIIVDHENEKEVYPNSWCYGDPGVAYGLLRSAHYLADDDLLKYVTELIEVISKRKYGHPYFEAGPGLLYGTSGLAMLYYQMYEMTGQVFLLEAYEYQIGRLISQFDQNDPYLGYKAYWNQELPVTNLGLSDGLVGVALTLMSYSNKEYQKVYRPFFHLQIP
jgi:hypothetical protein